MTEPQPNESGMTQLDAVPTMMTHLTRVAFRLVRDIRFVIAIVILAVSAIGLNATATFLQLHFRKESVPLRVKVLARP